MTCPSLNPALTWHWLGVCLSWSRIQFTPSCELLPGCLLSAVGILDAVMSTWIVFFLARDPYTSSFKTTTSKEIIVSFFSGLRAWPVKIQTIQPNLCYLSFSQENGDAPIHVAVRTKSVEMCKLLIQSGAKTDTKNVCVFNSSFPFLYLRLLKENLAYKEVVYLCGRALDSVLSGPSLLEQNRDW